MSDYKFDLPYPPSVNTLRACVRNRLITSKRGREYFKEVAAVIEELGLTNEMIANKVIIDLILRPKTNHKYDVSNYLKAYEDALVKCGFLEDDHWIEYGSIRKANKVPGGRLTVKITVLD